MNASMRWLLKCRLIWKIWYPIYRFPVSLLYAAMHVHESRGSLRLFFFLSVGWPGTPSGSFWSFFLVLLTFRHGIDYFVFGMTFRSLIFLFGNLLRLTYLRENFYCQTCGLRGFSSFAPNRTVGILSRFQGFPRVSLKPVRRYWIIYRL